MSQQNYTFQGWVAKDKNALGNLSWEQFEPKPWTEDDVDIEISHCGVCGSDIHTIRSGWGPTDYPAVVGHELVGKAVRVGKNVKHIKVGDIAGVGAQTQSCQHCKQCEKGDENFCAEKERVDTYAARFPDGSKAYGGYANYHRGPGQLTFKIPDGLKPAYAGPMLCGGVTVFTPLKENGCGPGKRVGIIGLGGLGHFGVLFARALGADKVVAISRHADKRKDALALGADKYIATSDDKDWAKENAGTLDLIVCTVSAHSMPLRDYLGLLDTRGRFLQVGLPEGNLPEISASDLIPGGKFLGGSIIGSRKTIEEMLHLAAEKQIKPWVQEVSMKDANQATLDFEAGKPKYRFVLVN